MPLALLLNAIASDRLAQVLPIALPVATGAVAVYLLLPRPRGYPPLWGAAFAAATLIEAGLLLIRHGVATVETVLFYTLAAVAVISGGLLITLRQPARAALSFALVVLSTCGLFLLQAAPFLMAATVIIYAGAIVVTFLFVLMLAHQGGLSNADHRSREPALATLAGFVLLGALLYFLRLNYDSDRVRPLDALIDRAAAAAEKTSAAEIDEALGNADDFFDRFGEEALKVRGSPEREALAKEIGDCKENWLEWRTDREAAPAMQKALKDLVAKASVVRDSYGGLPAPEDQARTGRPRPALPAENVDYLGRLLFTDYLLAVELAGALLLVATVGAIVIAGRRTEGLR